MNKQSVQSILLIAITWLLMSVPVTGHTFTLFDEEELEKPGVTLADYISKKSELQSKFNKIRFAFIEFEQNLGKLENELKSHGHLFTQGQIFTSLDQLQILMNTYIASMATLTKDMAERINVFDYEDVGLMARMKELTSEGKGMVMRFGQFRLLVAAIALNPNAAGNIAEESEEFKLTLASYLIQHDQAVQELRLKIDQHLGNIDSLRPIGNGLTPNLNSLFSDKKVKVSRRNNNLILEEMRYNAASYPDRNFLLLRLIEKNKIERSPEHQARLEKIIIAMRENNNGRVQRLWKKHIMALRHYGQMIPIHLDLYYVLGKIYSLNSSNDNFEILKFTDLFDRVKSKRDYLGQLQVWLQRCVRKEIICDSADLERTEGEFSNHRASLVTLSERFQKQYLVLHGTYLEHGDLMSAYIRWYSYIARQLTKRSWLFF